MSLHTAGDLLTFHPHVHSLVLPGVITPSGEYKELSEIDTELLTELFQEKILSAFLENGLLSEARGSMKIKSFIIDPEQVSRICKNLGLQNWRAPPKPVLPATSSGRVELVEWDGEG